MSYAVLVDHHLPLYRLRHVEAIVSWDEYTMMPTGGGEARGEALAALRGVIHQHATRAIDFDHGRLDTSCHPFTGGVPEEARITIRYDVRDFAKSVGDVLHELGHAECIQNSPRDWLGQPVGAAPSMSIHESQSLLLEMHLCRSRAFMEFVAPIVAQAFPALPATRILKKYHEGKADHPPCALEHACLKRYHFVAKSAPV